MTDREDEQWREADRQHQDAVRAYIAAASKIDADAWRRPVAEGKWSPAEITEHLKLAYTAASREIKGGDGVQVRTNRLLQRLLRFAFLPRLLKTGKFPKGADAPPEMKPAIIVEDQTAALARLSSLAGEFQSELSERRGSTETYFTHHVFGRLSLPEVMRLATVHIIHHRKQLP